MRHQIKGRWEGSNNLVSRSYTFDGEGPRYNCTLKQSGAGTPPTSTRMSAEVVGKKVKLQNLNPFQDLLGGFAGLFGFGPQNELVIEGDCDSLRLDTTMLGMSVTLRLFRVEGGHRRTTDTSPPPPQEVNCIDCGGTGKVRCRGCTGGWVQMGGSLVVCAPCRGTQKIECLSCNGTGKRRT